MIEPGFAMQTLIGDRLAADPAIAPQVNPVNICAGSIRPEKMATFTLTPVHVAAHGRGVESTQSSVHVIAPLVYR